jgi:hypothetical protein
MAAPTKALPPLPAKPIFAQRNRGPSSTSPPHGYLGSSPPSLSTSNENNGDKSVKNLPPLPMGPKPTLLPKEVVVANTRASLKQHDSMDSTASSDNDSRSSGVFETVSSRINGSTLPSGIKQPITQDTIRPGANRTKTEGRLITDFEDDTVTRFYSIHICTPKLDVWKKMKFPDDPAFKVKDVIEAISSKVNATDQFAHSYILRILYGGREEGPVMNEKDSLSDYNLSRDDILEFRLKPNPMTARFNQVMVTNLNGEIESTIVDLNEQSSQLLNLICMKYKYDVSEMYLVDLEMKTERK